MKKLIGVLAFLVVFALVGCDEIQEPTGLTQSEVNDLIEDYFEQNKDTLIDQLSEEDIEVIVAEYISENKDTIVGELTEEEIELIVLQYFEDNPVENFISTTYDLSTFEAAIVDMLEYSQKGVLGIIAVSEYTAGTGSGVIYKKEGTSTYYLVTNEHVVVHSEPVFVEGIQTGENQYVADDIRIVYEKNGLLFEKSENVVLLGQDVTTDLAVLQFESDEDFNVIPFGNSYDVRVGQFVYAIGNPLGFDYYGTVTSGIISGEARYQQDGDFDATLLQHDAAISPGNSGGALLNANGELIGINNMKIVLEDVSNIGFAIPVNTVKRIVADLEDDGIITRPYLGISTFAQINDCGLDYGVCVNVQEGGAAYNAGLDNGDIIIGYKNEGEDEFLEINNFNDLREAIPVEYESTPTVLNVHPDDQ